MSPAASLLPVAPAKSHPPPGGSASSVATSATGRSTESGLSEESSFVAPRQLLPIFAPPGSRPTRSGARPPSKTQLAVERKAAKAAKELAADDKKQAVLARKAEVLARRQERLILAAESKAAKAALKADDLRLKLEAARTSSGVANIARGMASSGLSSTSGLPSSAAGTKADTHITAGPPPLTPTVHTGAKKKPSSSSSRGGLPSYFTPRTKGSDGLPSPAGGTALGSRGGRIPPTSGRAGSQPPAGGAPFPGPGGGFTSHDDAGPSLLRFDGHPRVEPFAPSGGDTGRLSGGGDLVTRRIAGPGPSTSSPKVPTSGQVRLSPLPSQLRPGGTPPSSSCSSSGSEAGAPDRVLALLPSSTFYPHKKSKGRSGAPSDATTERQPFLQSPQRKGDTANKRGAAQSPHRSRRWGGGSRSSDEGSSSSPSGGGCPTVGEDSDDFSLASVSDFDSPPRGLTHRQVPPPGGGRQSPLSCRSSTTSCADHDREMSDEDSVHSDDGHFTAKLGAQGCTMMVLSPPVHSPPVRGRDLLAADKRYMSVIDGCWPRPDNSSLLSLFVETHFLGDWDGYSSFALWAKSRQLLSASPIRFDDWLSLKPAAADSVATRGLRGSGHSVVRSQLLHPSNDMYYKTCKDPIVSSHHFEPAGEHHQGRRLFDDALAMAYENFLIEVGLYGSPLQHSYEDFGHLATDSTWFQNFWCLVDQFEAEISLREMDTVLGVRENDRSLMSEFFRIGYRRDDLRALNVVRCFRNLLHLSDISKCDGITLDAFVCSDSAEASTGHIFPYEEPTPSDHGLWREAIARLCSGSNLLPCKLGPYLRVPHIWFKWYTTSALETLFWASDGTASSTHEVFRRRHGRRMRHGCKYNWTSTEQGPHAGTHYASVTMASGTVAVLHSSAQMPVTSLDQSTFLERLSSYGNTSLWSELSIDGDGEWIGRGIISDTLSIAHDGSHMAESSRDLCSAGVIIYCRQTKHWLKVSVAERSDAASNYRGELLGSILSLLILRAASEGLDPPRPLVVLHCDNCGVITHGNTPLTSLSDKQQQADLIRLMKFLSASNKCQS
jgi:hypothetical protein